MKVLANDQAVNWEGGGQRARRDWRFWRDALGAFLGAASYRLGVLLRDTVWVLGAAPVLMALFMPDLLAEFVRASLTTPEAVQRLAHLSLVFALVIAGLISGLRILVMPRTSATAFAYARGSASAFNVGVGTGDSQSLRQSRRMRSDLVPAASCPIQTSAQDESPRT